MDMDVDVEAGISHHEQSYVIFVWNYRFLNAYKDFDLTNASEIGAAPMAIQQSLPPFRWTSLFAIIIKYGRTTIRDVSKFTLWCT